MQINMEFKFQKRRGLGTVITTLIILIASVVLGAGVIFFGSSLFQTNTQSEAIEVSNAHIWVANNNTASMGFVVQNTGGKAVTINSITVRGLSVPTSLWWYNVANANATNIQRELTADYEANNGVNVDGAGAQEVFIAGTAGVSLDQGKAAFIYLRDPVGNIDAIDAGLTMTLQVQGGQATGVQSVSAVTKN